MKGWVEGSVYVGSRLCVLGMCVGCRLRVGCEGSSVIGLVVVVCVVECVGVGGGGGIVGEEWGGVEWMRIRRER